MKRKEKKGKAKIEPGDPRPRPHAIKAPATTLLHLLSNCHLRVRYEGIEGEGGERGKEKPPNKCWAQPFTSTSSRIEEYAEKKKKRK